MPKTKAYDYISNLELVEYINQSSEYRKKEETELRRIMDCEVGKNHITYILEKGTQNIHEETEDTFSKNCIVARNPQSLGLDAKGIQRYNQWLIPIDTVIRNYGQEVYDQLTDSFKSCKKKTTLKAVLIDDDLVTFFQQFDCVEDEKIHLAVSWGEMTARKGFYLTNAGYAISAQDFEQGYELIPTALKEKKRENVSFFCNRKKRSSTETINTLPEDFKRLSETTEYTT